MGRPLEYNIGAIYIRYKEVIFNYRIFRKTTITSRATFQDKRIEELALAGNVEASSVRINIKIWRTLVLRIDKLSLCWEKIKERE